MLSIATASARNSFNSIRRYPIVCGTISGGAAFWAYALYNEWKAEYVTDNKSSNWISEPSSTQQHFSGKKPSIVSAPQTNVTSLPRHYDRAAIEEYWSRRPITVIKRMIKVTSELAPLLISLIQEWRIRNVPLDDDAVQLQQAVKLRQSLTALGPAFVKEDELIFSLLREELTNKFGEYVDIGDVFEGLRLTASASLGQVYKAKLKRGGDFVAIKIQRPDMTRCVSLDLYLLHTMAKIADTITFVATCQAPFYEGLVDAFARGSYMELDEQEAYNQNSFRDELAKRKSGILIPRVHDHLTTQRVLTTEWIEGVKLVDASKARIKELIPVGVKLFLTQLLDMGRFHADPHPGNLLVTNDGKLCLLDFGLCAEVDEESRRAMTRAIVHLLMLDFDALVSKDAKELGFLPEDLDTTELQPLLRKILTQGLLQPGSDIRKRSRKLIDISNELNEVFFKYPFTVPPYFALVTGGLGLLEGIALSGDPGFDIFQASYPYAKRTAIEMFGNHSIGVIGPHFTKRTSVAA